MKPVPLEEMGMKLRSIVLAGWVVIFPVFVAPPTHALSNTFAGTAAIELHERLVHGDPYALNTSIVQLVIELDDLSVAPGSSVAIGTAIVRRDDLETTIRIEGSMYPPQGSGGKVWAGGVGDDGNTYCFVISDAADAPSPRPDRTIAAFEPADARVAAEAGKVLANPFPLPLPDDLCSDLLYRETYVLSGDFSFSSQL